MRFTLEIRLETIKAEIIVDTSMAAKQDAGREDIVLLLLPFPLLTPTALAGGF